MPSKVNVCSTEVAEPLAAAPPSARSLRSAILLLAFVPLLATGCLSSINKHAVALSAATAPVVRGAAEAYRSANTIHNTRQDYEAFDKFDIPAPAPFYNPRSVRPLLTDHDIKVRLAVLAAFQEYVKKLVAITNGTDSPELQAAATSVGQNLTSLGNDIAPSIQSVLNISSSTASSTDASPAISTTMQNGLSTAADALGRFLTDRKIKKELPRIIIANDPHVKLLCDTLQSDVTAITGLEERDYNYIIDSQTQFVLANLTLDRVQRRALIMELPEIVRKQQASTEALQHLSAAISHLETTHQALAADAQGNNPDSLKRKLEELEGVGADLGKFYSSLSTD